MTLKDKNLYYIGGVVRDEILGTTSFDTDFCYEGNAIEYAESKGLNIIKKNPDFGTVRILFNGKEIDIASTREEDYPRNGHLPVVKNIGCALSSDLKRRDFTINAMAKNTVTEEITDLFGGLDDIKSRKLRILHKKSFIDDPSRILRGLKFSVRFNFELEDETKRLQEEYLNNINYDMSYHRIKKELYETFNLNIGKAYDIFVNDNIYKLLSPTCKPIKINGEIISNAVSETNTENPFIIYYAFLNIKDSPIELTRQEKRILEWAEKLKTQQAGNNTPKESILIDKLRREFL